MHHWWGSRGRLVIARLFEIGVVPWVEPHDLDGTAERRRFPDEFPVRDLRRRPQSTIDTVIRIGEGLNIDPQITFQGKKRGDQVALLM